MKHLFGALFIVLLSTHAYSQATSNSEVTEAHKRADEAYLRRDYLSALSELRSLADQRDAEAQYRLGLMYQLGEGVPKDYTKTAFWFRQAAKQGHIEAMRALSNHLSKLNLNNRVPDAERVHWVIMLAEQGDPGAQYGLGWLYKIGLDGVTLDYAEAAKWYRRAAEQGDARSQAELGTLYSKGGHGLLLDYTEAMKWFLKAAEQGRSDVFKKIGALHLAGWGVDRADIVKAHMWFNLAAASGDDEAGKLRDDLAVKSMTSAQLNEAQRIAREWQAKHQR